MAYTSEQDIVIIHLQVLAFDWKSSKKMFISLKALKDTGQERKTSCLALSVPLSAFRRMGHGVGQRKAAEINLLKKLRKQEKSGQNLAI